MVKGLLETTDSLRLGASGRELAPWLRERNYLQTHSRGKTDRTLSARAQARSQEGGQQTSAGAPQHQPRGPHPASPPNTLKRRSRNTRQVGLENRPPTTTANPRRPDRHLCNASLSQPQAPLLFLIQKCLLFAEMNAFRLEKSGRPRPRVCAVPARAGVS